MENTSTVAPETIDGIWTRREDETLTAYTAFCAYRDLGAERTLLAAYQQKTSKPTAKQSSGHWNNWYYKNNWQKRAGAYDAFLDEVRRQAEVEKWRTRGEALAEKQFELAEALMEKASIMLKFPLEQRTIKTDEEGKKITIIEPARWHLGTAAITAKAGVELGRLAVGLPTSKEQVEISGPGGGPIRTQHEKDDPGLEADLEALKKKSPEEIHNWFMKTVVAPVITPRNGTS